MCFSFSTDMPYEYEFVLEALLDSFPGGFEMRSLFVVVSSVLQGSAFLFRGLPLVAHMF